ncbi:MAG: serine/threonine protein kinase, partial [Klebsiella aerogenes]
IQDNYQPLAELKPAGYSLPLLQAVDKALALRVEDRPQSIDAFAELIEMPVSSIDDVLSVKKTGTMLALVEEEEQAPAATEWRRYKVPGMVAAGVLVGIIAGGMLFSGGGSEAQPAQSASTQPPAAVTPPVTTQTANAQTAPPVAVQESKPAAAAAPVAQVYVRMREGEKLKLNGEPHNTQPATNGFASLKLAPGHYEITLQGNGQTREQTLEIAKPGTWLINPSS